MTAREDATETPSEVAVHRLTRDLAKAASSLTSEEARFLVDYFYLTQEDRKRATNQERALAETGEPHVLITWLAEQSAVIETQIKRALDIYTDENPLGAWAKSNVGIGPVIAAGLLAHIDINKAPTVGHIWRFAGLDPTVKWGKGERRPWNAALKTLCWKIGQSFLKLSNKDECFYGKLYRERKDREVMRNESGELEQQAKDMLAAKRFGKDTEAFKHYTAGRLPPAQINQRALRWAVKLFLAHYHEAAYRLVLKREPPKPYPIAILGHAHEIKAPVPSTTKKKHAPTTTKKKPAASPAKKKQTSKTK